MRREPFQPSELDGADESSGPIGGLLATARELERLDGGAIRPSDGFTDRVLAAIGAEPLPRPTAVAGLAARQGRLWAMLAALRDTWHVAWSGGRPFAVRAQAMAFVLILVAAMGSVGGLATVGAINALFPPDHASPSPTLPSPTLPTPTLPAETRPSPEPTETAPATGPSATPEPSDSAEPTETDKPGETAKPGETPDHTSRPGHTETPEPSETPEASDDGGGGGGGGGGGSSLP